MYSPFPPATLMERLQQARQHVADGEGHLARQREIVGECRRLGLDAAQAESVLSQFEELQALRIADRDSLEAQLAGVQL